MPYPGREAKPPDKAAMTSLWERAINFGTDGAAHSIAPQAMTPDGG